MSKFIPFILMMTSTSAFAQSPAQLGEQKAKLCIACHGNKGISNNPVWPNLAGQKSQYIVLQLKDFRDNRRQNPLMNSLVQTLSDQDIENLAAYFSSLPGEKAP